MVGKKAMHTSIGAHAVVIGGSIAGLFTARVLSDYFDRVTIFEADSIPDQVTPRRRVPQGGHAHTLLAGGALVMQKFYPALHEDLIAAGAKYGDMTLMSRVHAAGRWKPQLSTGALGYFMSRPLLEDVVRKHTCAIKNVQLCSNESVSGYMSSADNCSVAGVVLEKSKKEVAADLVVDASGRCSITPNQLKQLGYGSPKNTSIGANIGYTTFELPAPENIHLESSAIYLLPNKATDTRGLSLFHIEGNRYIVTGAGAYKDYPPTDWVEFLEFAKGFSPQNIYEVIKNLQPLGPVRHFRYGESVRYHYEDMRRFPRGLIVVGDAVCSFNPLYSQGMTVAAKEAEYLAFCIEQCMARDTTVDRLAPTFFKGAAAKIIDVSWNMVALLDLKNPQTKGKRPWRYNFAFWLYAKYRILANVDEEFGVAYSKVVHMMEPRESLMKLKYFWRAMLNHRW